MRVSGLSRRARTLIETGDFFPIFVLIVSIQGTVLVSQGLATLFLPPDKLGQIRTFESVISIGILVAGFGAPALAIREIASHPDDGGRTLVLRNLILLPLFGALITGFAILAVAIFASDWLRVGGEILFAAIFLLMAANLVRLSSAASQGMRIVRSVYGWVIAGSILAVAIQLISATTGDLTSWVVGRVVAEVILLISLLVGMRYRFSLTVWTQRIDLARLLSTMGHATLVNAGLILRMIADAAPILMLNGIFLIGISGASLADVGHFGVATLFLTAAQLIPAVLSQRTLPYLASERGARQSARAAEFRRAMFLTGCIIALFGSGIGILALHFDDGRLRPGLLAALAALFAVPLKSLATAYGTIMLAQGHFRLPVWVTLGELFCIVLVVRLGLGSTPLWQAVAALICGSLISVLGMLIASKISQRDTRAAFQI